MSYRLRNVTFESNLNYRANQVYIFPSRKIFLKNEKTIGKAAEKQRKTIEDAAEKQAKAL